jgi:hypothetical protein
MDSGRHGASVEEMSKEVNKTREQLESADKGLKHTVQLNKALKASLITLLGKWQEFWRHIALRCKLVFVSHLSQRVYYGKVLFNHDAQTLMLRVSPLLNGEVWGTDGAGERRYKRMTRH